MDQFTTENGYSWDCVLVFKVNMQTVEYSSKNSLTNISIEDTCNKMNSTMWN